MRDNKGQFKKGEAPGRPAGIPNKLTRTVREVVLDVFNKLQNDPDHNLEAFAKRESAEFYKIAAKLIPAEITGNIKQKTILEIVRRSNSPEPTTPESGEDITGPEAV